MTPFRDKRRLLGAIITLSCTWVFSYAYSSLPRLPDVMNEMGIPESADYGLDANEDTNLFSGQSAVFACCDFDIPGIITHWFINGKNVASSKRLSRYDMKIGSDQYNYRISIGSRPRRIHSSRVSLSQEDDANSNTTSLTEFTVLQYGILRVNNVRQSHAGEYSCVIEDYYGKTLRRKFLITVTDAPSCTLQPSVEQHLYRHANTRLKCAANFKGNVYHWKKDGEMLHASGFSKKFNSLENGALQIFDLATEDSGNYTCHIETPLGWISCGPAKVEVADEDMNSNRSDAYQIENVTVRPPQDIAEMECLLNNINASYGWSRELPDIICGSRMCPHNRVGHSPHENNLILKKMSTKDNGFYVCRTKVPGYPSTERETRIYLDVLAKPEINVEYRSKMVYLARMIKITCRVTFGNPPAEVYWVKDGVRTDTEEGNGIFVHQKDRTAFLTITNAEITHRGYYQCVASNSVGTVSSVTFLYIPEGRAPPTPQNLTAVAVSPTRVVVDWIYPNISAIHSLMLSKGTVNSRYKNFVVDKYATHYVFSNMRPSTKYTIKLRGFARNGPTETVSVRVETPEGKPCGRVHDEVMHAIPVNMTTLLLTWKSIPLKERCTKITQYKVSRNFLSEGEYHQQFVYVNNSLAHDDKSIVTEYKLFTDLRPGSTSFFEIRAMSSKGFGPISALVQARTFEEPVTTCMPDGTSFFRHAEGYIDEERNIRLFWATRDIDTIENMDVTVMLGDGSVVVQKELRVTDIGFTLNRLGRDRQPVYIIKMEAYNDEWKVCETRNFTVERKKNEAYRYDTHPRIYSGVSLGPRCIQIGWEYNLTVQCTFVVRYRLLHSDHFKYTNTSARNMTICNLRPWTDYEYGVAVLRSLQLAYHELDYAVSDSYVKTGEIKPGTPHHLKCGILNGTQVFCTWSPPLTPNGYIRNYTLQYEHSSQNSSESTTTDTQILLKCLKPLASYRFSVVAANDVGISKPSTSFRLVIPFYQMASENCSVIWAINPPQELDDPGMDDATFGAIIASIVLAACFIIGISLICIFFPQWRLCKKKCMGVAGKSIPTNRAVSNGKIRVNTNSKSGGAVHLELLTDQNSTLLSDNNTHANGKVANGSDRNVVKKKGIHKTSFMRDVPDKQEARYENGKTSRWNFFQNNFRHAAAVPEDEAVKREQSQHLILSVPIPKHRSVSSDARSSLSTNRSISIDSMKEDV